jgi:hypothetical protein
VLFHRRKQTKTWNRTLTIEISKTKFGEYYRHYSTYWNKTVVFTLSLIVRSRVKFGFLGFNYPTSEHRSDKIAFHKSRERVCSDVNTDSCKALIFRNPGNVFLCRSRIGIGILREELFAFILFGSSKRFGPTKTLSLKQGFLKQKYIWIRFATRNIYVSSY